MLITETNEFEKKKLKVDFFCRRRLKISQRVTKRKEERTKFVTHR